VKPIDNEEAEVKASSSWGRGFWVASLPAIGLAAYVALFLDTVRRGFVRAPFGDAFDFLDVEFRAEDLHRSWKYLWIPHNGHHLVWIRALTALDVRLFHGKSAIFVLAAVVSLISSLVMIVWQILGGVANRSLALALSCVAILAMLTTLNAIDVSVPVNTVYVLCLPFALGALVYYENGSGGLGMGIGVLALATAGAMGNSIGLAAVPVLIVAALRRPGRPQWLLLWAAGPILVALFMLGAGSISVEAPMPAQTPVERGVRIVQYFMGFCGLPWSASSQKMALPGGLDTAAHLAGGGLGLVLIALGLFLAARPAAGDDAAARLDRMCCSFILFSLAAAGMAALGRANASPDLMIPVRYALLMAPLHIGVAVLLLTRSPWASRWSVGTQSAALALVMVLAIGHQLAGRYVVLRYCGALEQTLDAFNAGRRSPEMTQYVYPQLERAEQVSAEMKRRGVYQ
jgi:hypothetical protein